MSYLEQISSLHIDILQEIGNIGAGNAATALSKMIDKKIEIKIPNVRVVSFDEVMELAGGAEKIMASVYFAVGGDISSHMFFVLPVEQAERLVRQMTGNHGLIFSEAYYDDVAFSAFQELGNILVSSYLTSLSNFTGLNMYPSVPGVCIDMIGAILSCGLIQTSFFSDYCIVIETSFTEVDRQQTERIEGHFFLFPEPDSFANVFQALGVAFDE